MLIFFFFFAANFSAYEADEETLSNLREYALANSLFWAMAEGHACEISVSFILWYPWVD
jgi:hypothetical protein